MSSFEVLKSRWVKIIDRLNALDEAFNPNPVQDHARRLASIEARLESLDGISKDDVLRLNQ